MTSMEYDVDSMGGLMPQILALTAPPGSREPSRQQSGSSTSSSKEGLAAHPYFRRPGRGHNHDSCDACGEGGDLICCDVCPASFHLLCHDPPLDEEDIPMGQWACHQCRVAGPEDDRTSVSSGKSNKSAKGVKRKEKEDESKPSFSASKGEGAGDKRVCSGGREFEVSDSPLLTLIKAAASVNPKQFILPYEMTLPSCFPGEPKNSSRSNGNRKGSTKKKAYELDNGLVPLPAKLCFQCNKSCRVGPLIPCDYCQLYFHLDCLDPPLATPPMGRWMCPNHPEHFVDSRLLTSHGLSERVKLWDKFSVPVDQDAVRLEFFQHCHRKNPPFRYKVKRALRSRIRVPASVKTHYLDPPDLLPQHGPPQHVLAPDPTTMCETATTATTTTTVPALSTSTPSAPTTTSWQPSWQGVEVKEEPDLSSEELEEEKGKMEKETKTEERRKEEGNRHATKEEMDQWLAGLLHLQSSIMKHIAKKNNSTSGGGSAGKTPEKPKELNGPTPLGVPGSLDSSPPSLDKPGCLNGDLTCHDLTGKHHRLGDGGKRQTPVLNSTFQSPAYFPAKKGILKNQKGKGISTPGLKTPRPRKQTASEILSETLTSLASSLQNSITGKQEVSLSQLERSVVEVLAWQRLEELLCPPRPEPPPVLTKPLPARALLCPLVPDCHLQDWAVKSPSPTYSCQPVPMTYRIIRVGKGSHNHLDLSRYGHCNYVSQDHAAIFFDENTGHYELLNYSPHGSRVDSILYEYDHSERTVSQPPPPPLLQQVRSIINQRRGQPPRRPPQQAMTDTPDQALTRCNCKNVKKKQSGGGKAGSAALGPCSGGWEGGAVLHHGSHLRFGCVQFVFSILEEASRADWFEGTLTTYHKFFKQEEDDARREEETKVKQEVDEEEEEDDEEEEKCKKEKATKS